MMVADLNAMQLYCLIVLANVMVILVLYGLREISRVERRTGRAVMYFGAAMLTLLPAGIGLSVLASDPAPAQIALEGNDPLGIR